MQINFTRFKDLRNCGAEIREPNSGGRGSRDSANFIYGKEIGGTGPVTVAIEKNESLGFQRYPDIHGRVNVTMDRVEANLSCVTGKRNFKHLPLPVPLVLNAIHDKPVWGVSVPIVDMQCP